MTIEQEAGAEAEKLYPAKESVDGWPSTRYLTAMANRKGFIQGYIAGASRPVTGEMVEAAAREYHERGNGEGSYARASEHVRTSLLFRMECALNAAEEARR